MARLSGLQRDVLSLYRKCLREVRNKPVVSYIISPCLLWPQLILSPGIKAQFQELCSVCLFQLSSIAFNCLSLVLSRRTPNHRLNPADTGYRTEFQKHRSVNKKDFSAIEYLLRKGHRQLEMYASPGIRNIRWATGVITHTLCISP